MTTKRAKVAERLSRLEAAPPQVRQAAGYRVQIPDDATLAAMPLQELEALCAAALAEVELPQELEEMNDEEIDEWCNLRISRAQAGME